MSADPKTSSPVPGALYALAAFGLFAVHDAVVKHLGASYSAFQIVFFSVLLGFPLTTFVLVQDRTDGNLRPRHPWWMTLRTASAVVTGLTAFYAFSTLPLAQVYAILFAMPLLITVLSIPILGEQVRLRRWIAVLVGLAGVLVVLRPGAAPMGLGHAAALTAAISGSVSSVITRKIGQDERSMVMMLYPMLGNFVVMGAALPFVYKPMPLVDLAAQGAVALCAFIASLAIIAAYRRAEAVIVAPMQYSQLLWATLFGLLFFDERPDIWTAVGAAIIIGSGLYILLREGRSGASVTRPVLGVRARPETGTYARTPHLAPIPGRGGTRGSR